MLESGSSSPARQEWFSTFRCEQLYSTVGEPPMDVRLLTSSLTAFNLQTVNQFIGLSRSRTQVKHSA